MKVVLLCDSYYNVPLTPTLQIQTLTVFLCTEALFFVLTRRLIVENIAGMCWWRTPLTISHLGVAESHVIPVNVKANVYTAQPWQFVHLIQSKVSMGMLKW